MQTEKFPFSIRIAATLLSIVLIGIIMYWGKGILIPLFFALLAAFLLLPLCNWLEHKKIPRSLASLICILLLLIILSSCVYLFSLQLINFSELLPIMQEQIQTNVDEFQKWITHHYHINGSEQMGYLNRISGTALSSVSNFAQELLLLFSGAAFSVVFVFIYAYFILYYRSILKLFALKLFDEFFYDDVVDFIHESRLITHNYIFGLMLEMLIMASVNCLALSLLGIPYFMMIGLIAAVLNIIPYLGFFIAIGIAFIITLSTGGMITSVETILVMWLIHILDANILMPRIVGARVKMNALITILAVLMGNMIWGIPGMFLFIPLVAIVKILLQRIDGMEAWVILIGEGEKISKKKQKK
jgi:predicted PurR-regulated permease PerM